MYKYNEQISKEFIKCLRNKTEKKTKKNCYRCIRNMPEALEYVEFTHNFVQKKLWKYYKKCKIIGVLLTNITNEWEK